MAWMDTRALGTGPLTDVSALDGGTQNILVRFRRDGRGYLLRRPPLNKRDNSDATMGREARVLAALAGSKVPHPGFIAGTDDLDVMGCAFYLMEPVDGFNPSIELPGEHATDPAMQHRMGLSMVEAIASLGDVDYEAVGLADFGKPDGWLARQVPRWRSHLETYVQVEEYPGPNEIPGIDAVGGWLQENRPLASIPGIVHGDYHLANVLFDRATPEIAAIVDWELATLGDPLLDLGWLIASWPAAGKENVLGHGLGDGLPTRDEVISHYGDVASRPVDDAWWYATMACYKLGIILEGTWVRALAGKAPMETGEYLHNTTIKLFEQALGFIDEARR